MGVPGGWHKTNINQWNPSVSVPKLSDQKDTFGELGLSFLFLATRFGVGLKGKGKPPTPGVRYSRTSSREVGIRVPTFFCSRV